ncbi:MAG TPA: thiolase family protein [Desulfobacteraceae bacterium]|nr:thiolase family protein [Desulfobacteraceae bacterium]
MAQRVAIVGTGQTYHKSSRADVNGVELIQEAVGRALEDAGITRKDIDAVVIGNMDHFEGINYVDMWSIDGNGALNKPIMKVTTGGTTGTTVAIAAFYHVASGLFDIVLAIGWEKNSESDTTAAIITCADPYWERPTFGGAIAGLAAGAVGYMHRYGITERDAALISVRDRKNALKNPYAHLRKEITVEDVLNSPMLAYPIKFLDICPRTDGACAVVFASEEKARRLTERPAWVHQVATRHNYTYFTDVDRSGPMPTLYEACMEVYKKAGIRDPFHEIDVVEMYTPSSFAGLVWIDALGVCKEGEAVRLVNDGVTEMDGELPINPSGGVISTNPIGATGLIRVAEAAMQVSGKAGEHQIPDAKTALATGFGGCHWSDVVLISSKRPD